jgi:hypothetical protein
VGKPKDHGIIQIKALIGISRNTKLFRICKIHLYYFIKLLESRSEYKIENHFPVEVASTGFPHQYTPHHIFPISNSTNSPRNIFGANPLEDVDTVEESNVDESTLYRLEADQVCIRCKLTTGALVWQQ